MRDLFKRLLSLAVLFVAVSASAGVYVLDPPVSLEGWAAYPATSDLDMDCHDILWVREQTDCHGCTTHYSDGAIGVPSGVIYYGCTSNTPAQYDVKCVSTTECFTVYSETNSSTLNSDWIWTAGEWSSSPQYEIMNCMTTTGEVCSQEIFNYSFTNTACLDRELCYTYVDGVWVLNEERGPEYVGGNTINLTGTGTLIIDATATGNTIIGENNGDIYIGRGSKDNTLRGTVAADGVVHIGTNNVGNTILCDVRQDGSIHIGNSNTLNIIQAYLDDSEFSMRTANRLNKIAVHGYTDDNLKLMDHVENSIIAATKKNGTDKGIGWMLAESRNLTIGAGNETLSPFTMFTVSNTVGCIVNVATNLSGVTNVVLSDAFISPDDTVIQASSSTSTVAVAWGDAKNHYIWSGIGNKAYRLPTTDTALHGATYRFTVTTTNLLFVIPDANAYIDAGGYGAFAYSGSGGTNAYPFASVEVGMIGTNRWMLMNGRREWSTTLFP